jgi:hypothetical protein
VSGDDLIPANINKEGIFNISLLPVIFPLILHFKFEIVPVCILRGSLNVYIHTVYNMGVVFKYRIVWHKLGAVAYKNK